MSSTSHAIRPLGMLEKLYTARQLLGAHTSVIITTTYQLRSDYGDADLYGLFGKVVYQLIQRHSALGCYVELEDSANPKFMRLGSIRLEDVLRRVTLDHSASMVETLQRLHDAAWPAGEEALWKLVVMRDLQATKARASGAVVHIAFIWNHVLGDGLSGVAVQRSILHDLKQLERQEIGSMDSSSVIEIPEKDLVDPIEKLVALPLSWSFLLGRLVQEYAPSWLVGSPPPLWAGSVVQAVKDCPYRSRIRLLTIPADDLRALLAGCRKRGVTLTSLLSASVASTLSRTLPTASRFVGETPYTLRRVTKTSMDEVVNQTSTFEVEYPKEIVEGFRTASSVKEHAEKLWEVSEYFHAQMHQELQRCPRDNLVGLLPYVSDHVEFYRKKIGKPRGATWELSNVGVLKKPGDLRPERWDLENMIFTQGVIPFGVAFSVNCASVEDGCLATSVTWQDSVIPEEVVEALAAGFADLPNILGRCD